MTQTTFEQSMTTDEANNQTTEEQAIAKLVGENKKFKDAEALARGKLESDSFIEQLKSENAELRDELNSRPTSEDVLKLIKEQTKQPDSSRENTTPVLDEDTLSKLVESKLNSREIQKKWEDNERQADSKMKEVYGDKAGEILKTKASELGLDIKDLQIAARKSPSAFFKMMGLNETKQVPLSKFETGGKNTSAENVNTGTAKYGTKAYWSDLRKTNPNQYFSADVQKQVFKSKKDGTYDA